MMEMQKAGFAVRDLTVRYADGNAHMTALCLVSADFPVGGVTAIIGESGSGKSTLGQALFGALPTGAEMTGRILFDGVDIAALGQEVLRSQYWGKCWGCRTSCPPRLRGRGLHGSLPRDGYG